MHQEAKKCSKWKNRKVVLLKSETESDGIMFQFSTLFWPLGATRKAARLEERESEEARHQSRESSHVDEFDKAGE